MAFIIQGLDPSLFGSVSSQKQAEAEIYDRTAYDVDESPGYPCRITLRDADFGQKVALVSYRHHAADTPFAQEGPIFITIGPVEPGCFVDEIPPALARRKLSLRAYDQDGFMVDAILVDGAEAKPAIATLFERSDVVRIDAHNAIRGCFAAHIHRHATA